MKRVPRARRPGVRPTVGMVVEGDTEFEALPRLYRKHLVAGCPPIKPTNLGGVGSHLTPGAVGKMVAPKVIAHKAAGRNKVVVCIDREQRGMCASQFAHEVSLAIVAELASRGGDVTEIYVVIADRTFECWLLAGAKELFEAGKLVLGPTHHCFEGSLGEAQEKGVRELTRLLGRKFEKTRDGPSLFEALDFKAARAYKAGGRGSKSLDKLLRTLEC